jgi:hypothetical protein
MKNKILLLLIFTCLFYLLNVWFYTENFWITFFAVSFLPMSFYFFFTENNISPIFFGLILQWLSVTADIFYCNFTRQTLVNKYLLDSYAVAENIPIVIVFSIIGLYALMFGIWLSCNVVYNSKKSLISLNGISGNHLFNIYLIFSIISMFGDSIIWYFGGLTQIILCVLNFRYGFLIVLIYLCKTDLKLRFRLLCVVLLELVIGLTSYFASDFYILIIFMSMSLVFVLERLNLVNLIFFVGLLFFLFYYSVFWTYIKKDYRELITDGKVTQSNNIETSNSLGVIVNYFRDFDDVKFETGFHSLVDRVAYVKFFSRVVDNVPSRIEHTHGFIYGSAFLHFLKPRLFFPDKKSIDDSEHLSKYTGLDVAGKESATSISTGYFADAYIDFGNFLMFVVLFFLGFIYGSYYKYILLNFNLFWSIVFTSGFFFVIKVFELDSIKIIGTFMIYVVTTYFFGKYLLRFFNKKIFL